MRRGQIQKQNVRSTEGARLHKHNEMGKQTCLDQRYKMDLERRWTKTEYNLNCEMTE